MVVNSASLFRFHFFRFQQLALISMVTFKRVSRKQSRGVITQSQSCCAVQAPLLLLIYRAPPPQQLQLHVHILPVRHNVNQHSLTIKYSEIKITQQKTSRRRNKKESGLTILAVHRVFSARDRLEPSIMTESTLHLQLRMSNTIFSSLTSAWSDKVKVILEQQLLPKTQ